MTQPVLVYRGEALASYGFGDPHPFGLDRHGVFQDELEAADLDGDVCYAPPRRASVDDLLLFHTAEYIDKVSRMSAEGRGFLDEGDTPAMPGIFDAASDVVGTTLASVDAVMSGETRRAFIPIAGLHHAGRGHAADSPDLSGLGRELRDGTRQRVGRSADRPIATPMRSPGEQPCACNSADRRAISFTSSA